MINDSRWQPPFLLVVNSSSLKLAESEEAVVRLTSRRVLEMALETPKGERDDLARVVSTVQRPRLPPDDVASFFVRNTGCIALETRYKARERQRSNRPVIESLTRLSFVIRSSIIRRLILFPLATCFFLPFVRLSSGFGPTDRSRYRLTSRISTSFADYRRLKYRAESRGVYVRGRIIRE